MAQNQKEFDIHDANAVMQKFAQLRQALRQLDDDITGLLYIAMNQLQREQQEAQTLALAKEKKEKESAAKKPTN